MKYGTPPAAYSAGLSSRSRPALPGETNSTAMAQYPIGTHRSSSGLSGTVCRTARSGWSHLGWKARLAVGACIPQVGRAAVTVR
jgi:hypothetical protein